MDIFICVFAEKNKKFSRYAPVEKHPGNASEKNESGEVKNLYLTSPVLFCTIFYRGEKIIFKQGNIRQYAALLFIV